MNSSGGEIFIREYIRTELQKSNFPKPGGGVLFCVRLTFTPAKRRTEEDKEEVYSSHAKVIRSTRERKLKRKIIVDLRKSIVPKY